MLRECSGCFVVLHQICSAMEESDTLLLSRSVFIIIGTATGQHEAKEWIVRGESQFRED